MKPIEFKISDLIKALETNPVICSLEKTFSFAGICTDSRSINKNELFLALQGETFNGNNFIFPLIKKGIKGFIAKKGYFKGLLQKEQLRFKEEKLLLFETDNTLSALGLLAKYQRNRANVKVVAITGSNGKTTTRKITQEIFKTSFRTLATKGNFNNEIGLPLTLLKLSHKHEWAIVEMGMNSPGEISRLSKIASPDISIITNTSGAHLEGIGTIDNVAKAKAEIFDHSNKNSIAVLNVHDQRLEILKAKALQHKSIEKIIFFGLNDNSQVRAESIHSFQDKTTFSIVCNDTNKQGQSTLFLINSPAPFMVLNALAAVSAAIQAGIAMDNIKLGLENFKPVAGRMNIKRIANRLNLIDDTYNANPASVISALKTLNLLSKEKSSIAVLGDMLELGNQSAKLHYQVGQEAADSGIDKLFIFGNMTDHTIEGALSNGFKKENIFKGSKKEIAKKIVKTTKKDSWVLVKGSRGMAMEDVIVELEEIINQIPDNNIKGL